MLALKPLFTINRVTVFGDNADPDQFYYLPEQVHLATDSSGKPQFTLIKYMRDITDNPTWTEGQALGGGFLIFSVNLSLDADTRSQIIRQANKFSQGSPNLATAPFTDGTVRVLALDATDAPVQGRIRFVENVIGTTKPSLFGDLQATFSLELSQEGATMMEQAFEKGGQPIGLVYDMTFLGLRPAFDVTVKADYKRVYEEFNAKLAAQYMMIRAEIEAGFQKLIENKAIEVTVNSYTTDANMREQQQNALKFFTENLLKDFFTPSLQMPAAQSTSLLGELAGMLGLPQSANRPASNASAPAGHGATTPTTQTAASHTTTTAPPPTTTARTASTSAASIATAGTANPSHAVTTTAPTGAAATAGPSGSSGSTAAPTATASTTTSATSATSATATSGASTAPHTASGTTATTPATGVGTHPTGTTATTSSSGSTASHAAAPSGTSSSSATHPSGSGASGGGANAAGAAGGSNLALGFTMRYIHQDELKTFTMNWKEAAAAEQHHTPNGSFGIMLRGLNKSEHFISVNLDDDFFKRLKVMIDCPTPFASVGLSEVKVHLEYGLGNNGQPMYVDDVELKPDANGHITPQELTTALDARRELSYQYRVDFYFDPSTSIRGQKMHYTTDMIKCMDRMLTIDPATYVGMMNINVTAGELSFDQIPRVQVKMGYDDAANNFHVEDSFVLSKDKTNFDWRLRLSDPTQKTYWYDVTYFLPDDRSIQMPRQTASGQNLVVNEPWQDRLDLLVDALWDDTISHFVLQLDYTDSTNNYRYSTVKRMANVNEIPLNLSIPLLDRANRNYKYQITALGKDNSVHRTPSTQAADTYLLMAAAPVPTP
jgi:hypothetical protein